MTYADSTPPHPRGLARPLAMLACALALALLCWRGGALLTGPGAPVSPGPAEAALADVLTPVAGPGLSRLSITYNDGGGRTVLLLVDERASARLPELQRIAPVAAGIDPGRGDRLVIETLAFADGLPGRPDAGGWAELAGLAALVLIAGALAALARPAVPVPAPAVQVLAAPQTAERPREPPRAMRLVAPSGSSGGSAQSAEAALDLARQDPARAAAVLRGWMQAKDDPV